VQDTAARELRTAPAGFGVAWTVHEVPLRISARVRSVPELLA
jgi:hypothetical protein